MVGGRKLSDDTVIIEKDKTDFGVTDGLEVKLVFDVTGLGIFGSKKFSPSGEVIEERSDFNLGSWGITAVADAFDFPATDNDFGASDCLRFTGGEAKAGDAGDARESLATEAERMDCGQVSPCANFASGVSFKAKKSVISVHS